MHRLGNRVASMTIDNRSNTATRATDTPPHHGTNILDLPVELHVEIIRGVYEPWTIEIITTPSQDSGDTDVVKIKGAPPISLALTCKALSQTSLVVRRSFFDNHATVTNMSLIERTRPLLSWLWATVQHITLRHDGGAQGGYELADVPALCTVVVEAQNRTPFQEGSLLFRHEFMEGDSDYAARYERLVRDALPRRALAMAASVRPLDFQLRLVVYGRFNPDVNHEIARYLGDNVGLLNIRYRVTDEDGEDGEELEFDRKVTAKAMCNAHAFDAWVGGESATDGVDERVIFAQGDGEEYGPLPEALSWVDMSVIRGLNPVHDSSRMTN